MNIVGQDDEEVFVIEYFNRQRCKLREFRYVGSELFFCMDKTTCFHYLKISEKMLMSKAVVSLNRQNPSRNILHSVVLAGGVVRQVLKAFHDEYIIGGYERLNYGAERR